MTGPLHAFDLAWVNRLVADNLQVACIDHCQGGPPPPMDCLPCWALGKVQDDLAKGRIGLCTIKDATPGCEKHLDGRDRKCFACANQEGPNA